jgi:hypothetical protein
MRRGMTREEAIRQAATTFGLGDDPARILVQQIQAGGTVTCGNMTWTVRADCYFAIEGGASTGRSRSARPSGRALCH